MAHRHVMILFPANKPNTSSDQAQNGEADNEKGPLVNISSSTTSDFSDNNQQKQMSYRIWITSSLRERVCHSHFHTLGYLHHVNAQILRENETLTILLETSTLLEDCFSALQTIHEAFKVLYSDWAVGKNKQMKEAFKSVRTNEKITERVSTIMVNEFSINICIVIIWGIEQGMIISNCEWLLLGVN